jgi:UDP-N-acetylmuramyl tripeptide synthase
MRGRGSKSTKPRRHSRKTGSGKTLVELLPRIPYRGLIGHPSVVVRRIVCDSREVEGGDLFAALRGERVDGHDYITAAIERGAVAVLSELVPAEVGADRKVPFIVVENSLESMGHLAAALHDEPSREMTFVGVTGSNGKTTTAYLIERVLLDAGYRTGAITTIEDRWPGHAEAARFTTPQSHELQRLLAAMRADGVTHVVSEVSSHALKLHRMTGVKAEIAVFTNLSFEHQEFHPDPEDYYQAKKRLFTDHLRTGGTACINTDDACGRRLAEELDPGSVRVVRYDGPCGECADDGRRIGLQPGDSHGTILGAYGTAWEFQRFEHPVHRIGGVGPGFGSGVNPGLRPAFPGRSRASREDRRGTGLHGSCGLRAFTGRPGEGADGAS